MATVASKEELESARDEAMRAAQEGLAALREDAEAAILREREDLMSQIEAINQEVRGWAGCARSIWFTRG